MIRNTTTTNTESYQVVLVVQCGLICSCVCWTINTICHVVLPGVHQFNGSLHFLRNDRCLHHVMRICSQPKSSSHARQVDLYFFPRHSQSRDECLHDKLRSLRWSIKFSLFIGNIGEAIDRLHCIVSQERRYICTLDYLLCIFKRTFRISVLSQYSAWKPGHFGHPRIMSLSTFKT